MSSDFQKVYAIQGVRYTTINLLHALSRAKQTATKQQASNILLNGKPFGSVDHKGKLVREV
jgi:hypothetical protein